MPLFFLFLSSDDHSIFFHYFRHVYNFFIFYLLDILCLFNVVEYWEMSAMVVDTVFFCYFYNIIKNLLLSFFHVVTCSVAEISVMQILKSTMHGKFVCQ